MSKQLCERHAGGVVLYGTVDCYVCKMEAEIERLRERALPESCCDCRYCVDRDDHIPGCDNPIGAQPTH